MFKTAFLRLKFLCIQCNALQLFYISVLTFLHFIAHVCELLIHFYVFTDFEDVMQRFKHIKN